MNGLKYIRMRCNLSSSELANILGVTRQALSAWENGKKEIPKQRLEELSEYFGLAGKYFEELTPDDVKYLRSKAMFRYDINGKEAYRFKSGYNDADHEWVRIYFDQDREISLDDELIFAKKKKAETIETIEDIIRRNDSPLLIDQINLTLRNCEIYGMINNLMEHLRTTDYPLRIPLFYELKNIWRAMLLAYGLIDEASLAYRDVDEHYGEDGKWITELSGILKQHWSEEAQTHLELDKAKKEYIKKVGIAAEFRLEKPLKTVAEQVLSAEERHRID